MVRIQRSEPWTDRDMATAVREAVSNLVDTVTEAREFGLTVTIVGSWGEEAGNFSMDITIKRDL